jgi:hypothetical protein
MLSCCKERTDDSLQRQVRPRDRQMARGIERSPGFSLVRHNEYLPGIQHDIGAPSDLALQPYSARLPLCHQGPGATLLRLILGVAARLESLSGVKLADAILLVAAHASRMHAVLQA